MCIPVLIRVLDSSINAPRRCHVHHSSEARARRCQPRVCAQRDRCQRVQMRGAAAGWVHVPHAELVAAGCCWKLQLHSGINMGSSSASPVAREEFVMLRPTEQHVHQMHAPSLRRRLFMLRQHGC